MRVRGFQSHLSDQNLVRSDPLAKLKGVRVGIDVVTWLRSISALKDPFADALGGIPPGIFGFVDKELDSFKKFDIIPLFVFQGMAPDAQHSNFASRMEKHAEQAWIHIAKKQKAEAQKCFAVSTSRINGDLVYFIFQHLRSKGHECIQAPYLAGAQLAHFAEQGIVQIVFGPPGLLLYGLKKVVAHIDFHRASFDWVDLDAVLAKLQINRNQFIEVCLMAGTEYCLTYPYLKLSHHQQNQNRFDFESVVSLIKQAPLIDWMQTFPTEESKHDYVDGYRICKVLVQSSPVLDIQSNSVRPFNASGSNMQQVPRDFDKLMGDRLPDGLYLLMTQGAISYKLAQALAKGEWTDKTQPAIDTVEFRDMITSLTGYRQAALGLIAKHLPRSFHEKAVHCKAFWEMRTPEGSSQPIKDATRILRPEVVGGLPWKITASAVAAELERQQLTSVDFTFCLRWHANEFENNGPLVQGLQCQPLSNVQFDNDKHALAALIHFMLLEQVELIDKEDGGMTILGNVLKDTPADMQEPCLVALEMMKFGALSGEPFDAPPERVFPDEVRYPKGAAATAQEKAKLLLCRVVSLLPMKLKNDLWMSDVDFDLAAFHSLVRILKRSLRQLVEASLASALLPDLDRTKLLPADFMCATPSRSNHLQTAAMLPAFMPPRAPMGIVFRYFLDFNGEPSTFENSLQRAFPCCAQPKEDLVKAFEFWSEMRRCVIQIAEPLGAEEFAEDMGVAADLMDSQRKRLLL